MHFKCASLVHRAGKHAWGRFIPSRKRNYPGDQRGAASESRNDTLCIRKMLVSRGKRAKMIERSSLGGTKSTQPAKESLPRMSKSSRM
jgi:hypothetical protein